MVSQRLFAGTGIVCIILTFFSYLILRTPITIEVTVNEAPGHISARNSSSSTCAACVSKVPCSYNEEVDLRIIVITYDRIKSLKKCLDAIQNADYMGDEIALEIWIDRSVKGVVNKDVLEYARAFKFKHGRTCVHVQTEHVNVAFQWLYSWQPKPGTKELGVFIEDDVDVSVYFYRYIKSVRKFYGSNRKILGYCLNDENCQISKGANQGRPMSRPTSKKDMVFLYSLFCTWGFAPDPEHWRSFQAWYYNVVSKDPKFDPTTPEAAMQSGWYRSFKAQGRADTMLHEIYLIKYSVLNKLYTLHPNLQVFEPRPNSGLTSCRKEKGLHFSGKADNGAHVLKMWRDEFTNFPKSPIKMGWDGKKL